MTPTTATGASSEAAWLLVRLLVVLLPPVLVGWAFLCSHWRWLQRGQVLALLVWSWFLHTYGFGIALSSLNWLLPWGGMLLPLGMLLNGLTQARLATRADAYRLWVGLAVCGGANVLGFALAQLLLLKIAYNWLIAAHLALYGLAWWSVERLLRRRGDLRLAFGQPWWRTPMLAAAVQGGLSVAFILWNLLPAEGMEGYWRGQGWWLQSAAYLLLATAQCWLAGVLFVRLTRVEPK